MANPSRAFAALADPTRREIFERLAGAPSAVGELANELPVSRPAVSQHLRVLKDAGLVVDRALGTRRVYKIDPNGLGELRAWLDRFWGEALEAFKAEVERDSPAAQATPDKPKRGANDSGVVRKLRTNTKEKRR
jgi:DNA-binding transcriptional ArsR family regulator